MKSSMDRCDAKRLLPFKDIQIGKVLVPVVATLLLVERATMNLEGATSVASIGIRHGFNRKSKQDGG